MQVAQDFTLLSTLVSLFCSWGLAGFSSRGGLVQKTKTLHRAIPWGQRSNDLHGEFLPNLGRHPGQAQICQWRLRSGHQRCHWTEVVQALEPVVGIHGGLNCAREQLGL